MPAPSKNFTVIGDTSIDADSPLTETLMTYFRDNDIHLEEWLGKDYTAAQNHDHDGTNSKVVSVGTGIYFDVSGGAVAKVTGGSGSSYADVDISTNTPSGVAKHAIIVVRYTGSGVSTLATLYLRKDGVGTDQQVYEFDGSLDYSWQFIVPVSASEIFEWKEISAGTYDIDLVGYIV